MQCSAGEFLVVRDQSCAGRREAGGFGRLPERQWPVPVPAGHRSADQSGGCRHCRQAAPHRHISGGCSDGERGDEGDRSADRGSRKFGSGRRARRTRNFCFRTSKQSIEQPKGNEDRVGRLTELVWSGKYKDAVQKPMHDLLPPNVATAAGPTSTPRRAPHSPPAARWWLSRPRACRSSTKPIRGTANQDSTPNANMKK